MDKRIRTILFVLVGCFALLFIQLNNLQIRQASALDASKDQPPAPGVTRPDTLPRGDIVTADGKIMAESGVDNPKDPDGPDRIYPYGDLYTNITGYFDVVDTNSTGLENEYNSYLIKHQSSSTSLSGLLTEQSGTDTVATTINSKLQKVMQAALAPYPQDAAVAIDPSTGAILAMYGNPTFNPNDMASHNVTEVAKYYKSLDPDSGSSPLINQPTDYTKQPGSTFKVVTTSAIYDHDPKIATQVFPYLTALTLPQTNALLHNFGGESCGGPLAVILAQSCDTAYAKVGLELGAKSLEEEATAFGFNKTPPLDIPSDEIGTPCFPPLEGTKYNVAGCPSQAIGSGDQPFIAYSAIGQQNVTESALQDALIAATIANHGKMMTPHLMSAIVNDQGQIVTTYVPKVYLNSTSEATADSVRNLMLGVATTGTAAGLFPPSLHVAAKTGTAETGTTGCSSTWLIATAPAAADQTPKIAVAAVVPSTANIGCSETGAVIAGPIVAKIVDAYLEPSKSSTKK